MHQVGATPDRSLSELSVCVVGINYAPDTTGIAPYTTALASALHTAGAAVHVITGIPHYPQWRVQDERYRRGLGWEEQLDGIRVSRRRHAVPARPGLVDRSLMESSFFAQSALATALDRSDVVIAVTPSLGGAIGALCGSRGRPVGVLVQDLTGNAAVESGTTGGRAGIVIAKIEYQLLRRAALVGVVTPHFGDVLVRHGVDEAKVASLPNFTHTRAVDATRADARRRLGWSIDRFTVVHTGNMGMKQGLESVIEAAGLAERSGVDIDFVLVGDGNQRQCLERAGRGTSCLRFVEPLPAAYYPYALAAADVLILNERPGVVEMSMPSKLTSYCIASRPIVAAVEPGGITYSVLMADRAAEVVSPGSGDTLLAAVRELRADAARREELVVAARAMHLSRYGAHAAFERYRDFARSLGLLASE